MKVQRKMLTALLKATSRMQHVNGKAQAQVESCILRWRDDSVSTTSLVKDGKTSISHFSFKTEEASGDDMDIPVPDIERMLGVLKYHGDMVSLKDKNGKVVVLSKNKQTTVVGGYDAKAFSTSRQNLQEWGEQSLILAERVQGNVYHLLDDTTRAPFFTAKIAADTLHDALRCDGMNGQKLNRYTFKHNGDQLSVTVGDHFKGQTETIVAQGYTGEAFEAAFEGGLENIVDHYSGDVEVSFLDFRPEGQGIRLILRFDNGDWVFQAGVL